MSGRGAYERRCRISNNPTTAYQWAAGSTTNKSTAEARSGLTLNALVETAAAPFLNPFIARLIGGVYVTGSGGSAQGAARTSKWDQRRINHGRVTVLVKVGAGFERC